MIAITIPGQGLHSGARSRLTFSSEPGPVRLRSSKKTEARIEQLIVDGSARSTCVSTRDGWLRIGTVEHLFAALGAMGIYEGVVIEIDGPEIPLCDGGARTFVDALAEIGVSRNASSLAIARAGSIEVSNSRYDFDPVPSRSVEVAIDFSDARLAKTAMWNGTFDDFRSRIASARTFGFAHELEDLLERGLANHVAPESVVVIAESEILSAGAPFLEDEPARHKLLDLIGDLYAHGGPPRNGSIRATRPGHAATHEAMRRAFAEGLLLRL